MGWFAFVFDANCFNFTRRFMGSAGQVPKWTKGADCKSVAIGFQGSNPCLPTTPSLLEPASVEFRRAGKNHSWVSSNAGVAQW